MAKYRKKPVVIDAIQWDGTLEGVRAIEAALPTLQTIALSSHPPTNKVSYWKIGTLEGGHEVSSGDWIITGVRGEHYPCKPNIFAATYDDAAQPSAEPTTECTTCGATVVRVTGVYDYPPPGDELVRAARDALVAMIDGLTPVEDGRPHHMVMEYKRALDALCRALDAEAKGGGR